MTNGEHFVNTLVWNTMANILKLTETQKIAQKYLDKQDNDNALTTFQSILDFDSMINLLI
jgi:hypothetical protein